MTRRAATEIAMRRRPIALAALAAWLGATPAVAAENKASRPAARSSTERPRLPLTLADAVFIGLRNNPAIRSAYIDREAQRFDLKVAEDVFTPHAVLAGGVTHSANAGQKPIDSATFAPTITELTPTGANVSLAWSNSVSKGNGASASSSVLTASFVQPLLKGAGEAVNLAPVQTARLTEDINKLNLRTTISQTVTTIITDYRALMNAEETKALDADGVLRVQSLIETDAALIEAGRLPQVELIQAQAALENQKLVVLQDELQIESARLALATLLDIDLNTDIGLLDKIEIKKETIDPNAALAIAYKRRPDYLAQIDVVEQGRLGILVAENQRLWDVSLVGGASLGRQTQTSLGQPATSPRMINGSIGLQVTAPLNDLTPEQNAIHAGVAMKDAEIQLQVIKTGVQQQVLLSARGLDLDWRQVEAARRVESLAANAVDIEKLKLSVGKSSTFQVQSLEANYRAARLQRLNAEIAYLNAITAFDLQLGTTLDTWKIALCD